MPAGSATLIFANNQVIKMIEGGRKEKNAEKYDENMYKNAFL